LIRLPAARADIARLLLLYEIGGLYVDCHIGIRDANEIRALLAKLDEVDLIFFDKELSRKPRHADEHFLINGIILSRPKVALLHAICRQAFANLDWHRREEGRCGRYPYNIHALTGPQLVTAMVLQPGSCNRDIRSDLDGRIMIIAGERAPFERGRHKNYGGPGLHWSERQKVEPLFNS